VENRNNRVKAFYHNHRGQTLFDFVLGITLFLAVVAFTIAVIPDLLEPFEPDSSSNTVIADRGADHLSQGVLRADGAQPYVFDTECTVAFFDGNAVSACDVSNNDLQGIIGMRSSTNAYVKIIDSTGSVISVNGVKLEYGNDISESTGDVYTATRIVRIENKRRTLVFNVW